MSRSRHETVRCDVCGQYVPMSRSVPAQLIRPAVAESILKDHSDWTSESHICLTDLNRYRSQYVQNVLETERGELSSLEKEVVESLREHELLAANANQEFDDNATLGEAGLNDDPSMAPPAGNSTGANSPAGRTGRQTLRRSTESATG